MSTLAGDLIIKGLRSEMNDQQLELCDRIVQEGEELLLLPLLQESETDSHRAARILAITILNIKSQEIMEKL